MSEPVDAHLPDNINAAAFENPTQKGLRIEFQQLTTWNRDTLNNFNPNVRLHPDIPDDPDARAEIKLTTDSLDDERREPAFTGVLREGMLRELNLAPAISTDPEDPNVMFQYEFPDGDVQQIRIITRADGVRVPVFTTLLKQKNGHFIASVELLSLDLAEKTAQELRDYIKEGEVDKRLYSEFGIEPEFTEQAHFTLEDKESMLQAYDNIQNMDTAEIDLTHLSKSRMKLLKAMLPTTQWLKNRRERHLPHLIKQYDQELVNVIKQSNLDEEGFDDLIQRERLMRLSGLNRQLKTRQRLVKTTMAGAATAFTTLVSGTGAAIGLKVSSNETLKAPLIGAAIGAVSAIVSVGLDKVIPFYKRNKYARGFSEIYPEENINEQLNQEMKLSDAYFHLSKAE